MESFNARRHVNLNVQSKKRVENDLGMQAGPDR